jgi:hypothetical protein
VGRQIAGSPTSNNNHAEGDTNQKDARPGAAKYQPFGHLDTRKRRKTEAKGQRKTSYTYCAIDHFSLPPVGRR